MKARRQAKASGDNATAAEIILADPIAHGGEESLAVRWARAWRFEGERDVLNFQNNSRNLRSGMTDAGKGEIESNRETESDHRAHEAAGG